MDTFIYLFIYLLLNYFVADDGRLLTNVPKVHVLRNDRREGLRDLFCHIGGGNRRFVIARFGQVSGERSRLCYRKSFDVFG